MIPKQAGGDKRRPDPAYRGRFAPSPTGPLHFGSLITATASYLQALSAGGEWLLRIEDIDPPREQPGAAAEIIATLSAHKFQWTGPVQHQSTHQSRFEAILKSMLDSDLAFRCTCSRKQVRAQARIGRIGPVYPGTCRTRQLNSDTENTAIRLRTGEHAITFEDRVYGRIDCSIGDEIGDFVIRRADGLIAYALAVVIDDFDQGVTEVVRGGDLLDFTPAQIFLQQILGFNTPAYMHVPVAVNINGKKLSKQTGATPVDDSRPSENLVACLKYLRQDPPATLSSAPPDDIWAWARAHWAPEQLKNRVNPMPDKLK